MRLHAGCTQQAQLLVSNSSNVEIVDLAMLMHFDREDSTQLPQPKCPCIHSNLNHALHHIAMKVAHLLPDHCWSA